ncbi:hypothetical protein ACH3XW_38190 [Acanthocheilonema viteae]
MKEEGRNLENAFNKKKTRKIHPVEVCSGVRAGAELQPLISACSTGSRSLKSTPLKAYHCKMDETFTAK